MNKLSFRKFFILNMLMLTIVLLTVAFLLTACSGGGLDNNSSQTNNQEEGIDEADIVKVNSDGYIFKAQTDGVTVSKIDNNGKLSLIKSSEATKEFTPKEMFVYEDKYIVVIGASAKPTYNSNGYYYASSYSTTIVKIYDLTASEEEKLILVREDEFSGTYHGSRLFVGNEHKGELYLITNFHYKSDSKHYVDYFDGEVEFDITDGNGNGNGFLIAKLDMKIPNSKYETGLYAGNVYDIYFSRFAIYIMRQIDIGRGCQFDAGTEIDKISLDNLKRTYSIKDLNGFSPNRFCLYDSGSYLYVVNQRARDAKEENPIEEGTYVYTYSSSQLKQKANIGPFASDEDLKSARFDGDFCYVVTFRVVDPLFKIDLSDPLNPRLTGELKIDGFSTYLQSFSNDLLIGIGYADNRAHLKITAFEVSGDYPSELNSIELQYGYAEALENARAILCEPDKNIFAFSAQATKLYSDDTRKKVQGAYIFGLKDGEFQEIAFLSDLSEDFGENTINSRRKISRIHWIGENLIIISDGFIISYNLNDVMEGNPVVIDKLDTRIIDESITIQFETGDDSIIVPPQVVVSGDTLTQPEAMIREGYQFQYWYKDNENIKYNFGNIVNESFTLHAKWQRLLVFTVTFNTGFSDIEPPPEQFVAVGGKIIKPEEPVKEGYTFLFWSIIDDYTEYSFDEIITEDIYLVAIWDINLTP